MSGRESFELIALCEQILEDGEVTASEVTSLGQWLAAHEETRQTWPGTVLAKPVEDALLDQSVNKTELRRIATLLRKVQKEWVARREERVQQLAIEKAAAAAKTMDLSQALLPSIPVTFKVKSHSDDRTVYEVDLSGPSCNCPDWTGLRGGLPRGSLTRCCKHVLDAYSRVRPSDGWPGWLDSFLEHGWKPHPEARWVVLHLDRYFTLLSVGGSDWANVFTVAGDAYQRFGFNVVQRRWSYGRAPDRAREIEKELLKQVARSGSEKSIGIFRRLFGW